MADEIIIIPEEASILDILLHEKKMSRFPEQDEGAIELLSAFIEEILGLEEVPQENDVISFLMRRIAEIDELLSAQINEVLHHPEFQKLEGSWRGIHYLVMNTETSTRLKLRVLNSSLKDLRDDLSKAIEFDQSELFKKIYEEEYGTFGGAPYSCLVGAYSFTNHPQDILFLEHMAALAAAAHAPFIAAVSPVFFNLDKFEDMPLPRDLSKIFESPDYIKWNSFRNSEDSRYVTLLLPRILMRLPYGPNTLPVVEFNFTEDVGVGDTDKFCWGNPAYALAQRITNAFALYSWTAAIRGVEGGGVVEGLPTYIFKTLERDTAVKCPTEVAITDRREKELSDLGFIAVSYCKGSDFAVFFGCQTTQKPKVYNLDDANANASISARLTYLLAASRFAHYIKVMMRDKVGVFLTRENVEVHLNNWLASYILLNDNAPARTKAEYPLREGRIDVYDIPGSPGSYKSVIYLRPHFQMEELTASIRLVANLPARAG
ncbi:MAG: type VI secretion system contractile sheath large subunit [Holosporales bacterium]|jgi:type VI secretion system protein ImpC|nr:type VI secretion system contractile sheath large subunit [Holosporales bacterium]